MTPDEIARLPYRPCVGVMLANLQGRVLTGQRLDMPGPAWQMPQGGVDDGEDLRTAALRELWEETGIGPDLVRFEAVSANPVRYDLPAELVPRFWKGRFRGQEQTWFLLRFLGRDQDVKINTRHPEFSAWKWSNVSDLVDEIVPFKREVYGAVVAELGERAAYC